MCLGAVRAHWSRGRFWKGIPLGACSSYGGLSSKSTTPLAHGDRQVEWDLLVRERNTSSELLQNHYSFYQLCLYLFNMVEGYPLLHNIYAIDFFNIHNKCQPMRNDHLDFFFLLFVKQPVHKETSETISNFHRMNQTIYSQPEHPINYT